MKSRLHLAAGLSLAASVTAFADIKVNDHLSIGGYVAASYEFQDPNPGPSDDSLFNGAKGTPSADAVKTTFTTEFKPVTGVVSLFYIPNVDFSILDAYVTYDAGGGTTLTAGKFLSYLGYEAFDPTNMNQITYGAVTVGTLGAIPAYHSGAKIDYADKTFGAGFAVVDSIYSNTYSKGDGELRHNAGFEGYVKSTATTDLTLWAGFAYDTKGSPLSALNHSIFTVDLWAEYAVSKESTIAAEFSNKNGGPTSKGSTWLAYYKYAASKQVAWVFRVSGESLSSSTKKTGAQNFVQYTVGPSFTVTDNLSVRAEYSLYDYSGKGKWDSKSLFGLQGIFKF